MKNHYLLKVVALLIVCCAMFACKPENENNSGKLGTIYGTVTDYLSGEPIANANVRLNPRGETTLTGSDGSFQFNDLPDGKYTLSISKSGYADLDDDYEINIDNGNTVQRAVQLQKLSYSLQIVDNYGNVIPYLDFGEVNGVAQKTFNINNNGNVAIQFTITATVNWIEEITPSTGTIQVGNVQAITIKVNESLLAGGDNTTTLVITTNLGAVEIWIKAKGSGIPTVTTGEITNITTFSAACSGNVVSEGGSHVFDRGICWGTEHNPTYDKTIEMAGEGEGAFTCNLTTLNYNTTYYVRAYARNSYGVAYGEEKTFTTELLATFQYGGHSFYVAPDQDLIITWDDAVSYCNGLNLQNLSGWRLPTKEELMYMYSLRNTIGGFCTNSDYCCAYWSSTVVSEVSEDLHYYVFFNTGSVWYNHGVNAADRERCRIRPIREVN